MDLATPNFHPSTATDMKTDDISINLAQVVDKIQSNQKHV